MPLLVPRPADPAHRPSRPVLAAAFAATVLLTGCGLVPVSTQSGGSADAGGATGAGASAGTGAGAPVPLPLKARYSGLDYTITAVHLHTAEPTASSAGAITPTPAGNGEPGGVLVRLKVHNTTDNWKIGLATLGLTKDGELAEASITPDRDTGSQVGSGTTIDAHAWIGANDPASLDGYTFDIHDSDAVPAVFAAPGAATGDGYPVAATVARPALGTVVTENSGRRLNVVVADAAFQLDGLPADAGRARKGSRILVVTLRVSAPGNLAVFTFSRDVRVEADGSSIPPTRCDDGKGGWVALNVEPGTTATVSCAFEVPASSTTVKLSAGATNPVLTDQKAVVKTVAVAHPPFPPIAAEAATSGR